MTARPTTATGRPTGVISNTASGSSPLLRSESDTTRLVEVPSKVMTPPSTLANDSGMRSFEALTPLRRDHLITRGAARATSGVLGTNAEMAPVVAPSWPTLPRLPNNTLSSTPDSAPVVAMAAATTYRAAMVAVAGLERPESTASSLAASVTKSTSNPPPMATTDGTRSITSAAMVPMTTASTIQASVLIGGQRYPKTRQCRSGIRSSHFRFSVRVDARLLGSGPRQQHSLALRRRRRRTAVTGRYRQPG